jgi:hypothetical protein
MSLNWRGLITQDSCDTGKLTWNTEPDPSTLSARIVPPGVSAITRNGHPRPLPVFPATALVRLAGTFRRKMR